MRIRNLTLLALVAGAIACSTLESGVIALVTGPDDAGPFNEPACAEGGTDFCGPAPTEIVISAVELEGVDGGVGDAESAPMVLGKQAYAGGSTVTLPQVSSDDVDILQATAYDSANAPVIFGQTLPLSVGGVAGLTLDLFVQRKGQFAIVPSPFDSVPASPMAAIVEGRYVLVAGGSSSEAELYDLLLWGLVESVDGGETTSSLPCTPLSMAAVEGTTIVLVLCKDGTTGSLNTDGDLVAYLYDVSGYNGATQVIAPGGDQWRSVAGGATVVAPNGDAFIVGGTRAAASGLPATTSVLKVGAAVSDDEAGIGSTVFTQFFTYNAARLGAVAAWSSHYGLVILGGNLVPDGGPGGVGLEFVGGAETDAGVPPTPTPLPFPTDLAVGEGAAAINGTQILVAGGELPDGTVPPVRLFDLGACSGATCAPSSAAPADAGARDAGHDAATPEAGADAMSVADAGHDAGAGAGVDAGTSGGAVPLLVAQGFAESGFLDPNAGDPTSALFVGTESDGLTHAYVVSSASFTGVPVPLRVARKGATAILTPIPQVLVLGGGSGAMESFIP